MNSEIKNLINEKNLAYKSYCRFNRDVFNTFFANQCTLLNNSSVLSNNLAKLTNKSLDRVSFSTDGISKIINNLDPNKAHGHDMDSIRMINDKTVNS